MPSTRLTRALAPLVSGLAVVLVAAGCGSSDEDNWSATGSVQQVNARDKVKVIEPGKREAAPKINGTTLQGESFTLRAYEGKVVVLNFWASWCGPCRDEIPVLKEVYKETRDRGVRVVGVDTKDSKANARAFVRNFDIGYPSVFDQPGRIALAFRGTIPPQNLPSTIIIDRDGRVAARIIGETTYTQLKPVVTRVADGR